MTFKPRDMSTDPVYQLSSGAVEARLEGREA